jgi:hypothetical protein
MYLYSIILRMNNMRGQKNLLISEDVLSFEEVLEYHRL